METFSETEVPSNDLGSAEASVSVKRPRGRPRKDGSPPSGGIAQTPELRGGTDIPNPTFSRYNHDHKNPQQRTVRLWAWVDELPEWAKPLLELYAYREWPVLIKPPKVDEHGKALPLYEQEPGYIAKLFYPDLPTSDQSFIDRWGAGDYFFILKFNPVGGKRRDLCRGWIKGTHDFRTYPPSDDRINDVATNLDLADPGNGSYIKALKSQGKLKDEDRDAKENEEMSAQAEVLGKFVEQNTKLTEKLFDVVSEKRAEPVPIAPVQSAAQETETVLGIMERLQKLTDKGDNRSELMNALEIAKIIAAVNSPNNEKIEELRARLDAERDKRAEDNRQRIEELHRQELRALNEKLDRLGSAGAPLQTVPTKSLIEQIKDAREMLAELGMDDDGPTRNGSKMPWWAETFLPIVEKSLPQLLQMGTALLMPRTPTPAPQSAPLHQNIQQQPQQIPPPQQQQVGPQTVPPQQQQQQPQVNDEAVAIQRILVQISGPVVDYLSRDEGGDDFADYFCAEYGRRDYKLISKFSAEEITQALYGFGLTAPHMTQFQQAKVIEFAKAFREYDPDTYDTKMAEREKGGAA